MFSSKFRVATATALSLLFASPLAAASVEGLEIYSTEQGRGADTIIFVHGWTCDESFWADQVAAFSGDYKVLTLDLPGHGQSDAPAAEAYSMKLFAAAVEAVRSEARVGKVVLVGHSMGAAVIRQYALDYPEQVAGLVAVDGPLDMRPFAEFPPNALAMDLAGRRALIESMFVPSTSRDLRAKVLGTMLGAPDATAVGGGQAMFDPANQTDRLIEAPALSVFAGQTNFAVDDTTREMVPDWQYVQMAGTGHFLMNERPVEFNALLAKFVEERAEF